MVFKAPKAKLPKEQMATYYLHRMLAKPQPDRPITTLHASEVCRPEFCARRVAIMASKGIPPKPEKLGTCQQMVYRIGRDVENATRQWFSKLGLLYGDWKCGQPSCGMLHVMQKKPKKCSACEFPLFHYREVRITSEKSGISCGLDLLLKLPHLDLPMLYELKTYDKDKFQTLAAPLADHITRTRLYLHVLDYDSELGPKIYKGQAGIIYVSKGGYGRATTEPQEWGLNDMRWSPFREFFIEPDPHGCDLLDEKAKPAHEFLKDGGEWPEGICGSPMEKRAQACEAMTECFG